MPRSLPSVEDAYGSRCVESDDRSPVVGLREIDAEELRLADGERSDACADRVESEGIASVLRRDALVLLTEDLRRKHPPRSLDLARIEERVADAPDSESPELAAGVRLRLEEETMEVAHALRSAEEQSASLAIRQRRSRRLAPVGEQHGDESRLIEDNAIVVASASRVGSSAPVERPEVDDSSRDERHPPFLPVVLPDQLAERALKVPHGIREVLV